MQQVRSPNVEVGLMVGGAVRLGATALSAITITRSAPSHRAGLIGVFRRGPPSKYQPAACLGVRTRTAGNSAGIAEEARMCSAHSVGVATYSMPRRGSSWYRGIPPWWKTTERLLCAGGSDHPERHPLLADVLVQLVEIHDPSKRVL